MLRVWLRAIWRASVPEVEHLIFFIGEPVPEHLSAPYLRPIGAQTAKHGVRPSIGYFHNMGAKLANTKWIMKLDVDAIPNEDFFKRLLPVLKTAKERQWFNAGMFYINQRSSAAFLSADKDPLGRSVYDELSQNIRLHSKSAYAYPAATNFICRTEDYLKLGGCAQQFQGYGWEDYQQIYMLERYQQMCNPLPGPVTFENVTKRCREEISRPKARQLWEMDKALALLHCWHRPSRDTNYRARQISDKNRQVLLDYIRKAQELDNGEICEWIKDSF